MLKRIAKCFQGPTPQELDAQIDATQRLMDAALTERRFSDADALWARGMRLINRRVGHML